jgi:hypothetical protein
MPVAERTISKGKGRRRGASEEEWDETEKPRRPLTHCVYSLARPLLWLPSKAVQSALLRIFRPDPLDTISSYHVGLNSPKGPRFTDNLENMRVAS